MTNSFDVWSIVTKQAVQTRLSCDAMQSEGERGVDGGFQYPRANLCLGFEKKRWFLSGIRDGS